MKSIFSVLFVFVLSLTVKAQYFYSGPNYIFFSAARTFPAGRNWAVITNGTHEGDFQIATGNANTSGFPDVNTTLDLAKVTISNIGNVGIGTTSPEVKLDIGRSHGKGLQFRNDEYDTYRIRLSPYWETGPNTRLDFNIDRSAEPNAGFTTVMSVGYAGNVGIGTITPDYKLTVDGGVKCEEVLVEILQGTGPDYVFEKDYNLLPLSEVEAYINEYKHLPEVPSAKEMEANGLNLNEMNLLLLKKVEELTLHLIEIKKENEMMKERLDKMENK